MQSETLKYFYVCNFKKSHAGIYQTKYLRYISRINSFFWKAHKFVTTCYLKKADHGGWCLHETTPRTAATEGRGRKNHSQRMKTRLRDRKGALERSKWVGYYPGFCCMPRCTFGAFWMKVTGKRCVAFLHHYVRSSSFSDVVFRKLQTSSSLTLALLFPPSNAFEYAMKCTRTMSLPLNLQGLRAWILLTATPNKTRTCMNSRSKRFTKDATRSRLPLRRPGWVVGAWDHSWFGCGCWENKLHRHKSSQINVCFFF